MAISRLKETEILCQSVSLTQNTPKFRMTTLVWKPGKVRELKKVREKSGKMKKSGKSQGIHVGQVRATYYS